MTQLQAAEAFGLSKSGYIKLEDGARRLTADYISRAAKAFGVNAAAVISPPDGCVPVMGLVGAGAEISPEFEQVPPDGLYQIDASVILPDGMIGFEVRGDSMYPRYDDGDVVIVSAAGAPVENLSDGAEAAVRTTDGRRFLKRLRRENQAWTLESHNAPPIRGVALAWASEVVSVVRKRQWRRINGT